MDAFPEYGSGLGEDFALDEDGAEEGFAVSDWCGDV